MAASKPTTTSPGPLPTAGREPEPTAGREPGRATVPPGAGPTAAPAPGAAGSRASTARRAGVTVHRVTVGEAARVRALRLEMLADSPLAFLETPAQAAACPHAEFERRIARSAAGNERAQFVAELDGRLVGHAGGTAAPDDPASTVMFAVYVTPACRGTGVLDQLAEAVAGWSRSAGRPRLMAEVVSGNTAAVRAYRRLGFVPRRAPAAPEGPVCVAPATAGQDGGGPIQLYPHPTIPGLTELVMTRPA